MAEIGFAGTMIVLALAVLSARGHTRLAFCWSVGIATALVAALLLKWVMADDDLLNHFPSGHVVLAVVFYGGLVVVLLPRGAAPSSVILILASVAVAEGVSRVVLTEHGWMDVAGGFVVGIVGLAATGSPWAWNEITARDRLWLVGALMTGAPFAWLVHFHIDPVIRGVAGV